MNHIEPALAALVLGNKRLRPTEALCDFLLGKTCLLARCDEQLTELGMLGENGSTCSCGAP